MEVRMRSLFAMILAMMVSFPAVSSAQPDQTTLRRVHVMTGAGTLPRNPMNRLGRVSGDLHADRQRTLDTAKVPPRAT